MIWQYKEIKNSIKANNLISFNEGNTPVHEFKYKNTNIILKREDLNPTGSWKDRGTAYKITELINNNIKEAVLFSSGNAAISFLTYANTVNDFKLNIVVSKNTNDTKLNKIKNLIQNTNHTLLISDNPKKDSVQIAAQKQCINLKASIDESILKGYWSLGFELVKYCKPNLKTGIFFPVSSGNTIVGTNIGMQLKLKADWLMPKFFAIQTQKINPIVKLMDSNLNLNEHSSLADAIIDSTALRGSQVAKIVRETGGFGYAILDSQILQAKEFIESNLQQTLSFTSLLSVAGFLKAIDDGINLNNAILIASGS